MTSNIRFQGKCSNFAGEDTAASWCLELDPQNHVGEPALLCMCPQTSTLPLCPKHPSTQQVLTGLELTEIRLLLPPNVGIQGIYHHTFGYKFLFFFFFNFYLFIFFRDRVSLCSTACPGTHSVDQAGLELRNPPASASQVLGLKACTTTAWLRSIFLIEAPSSQMTLSCVKLT